MGSSTQKGPPDLSGSGEDPRYILAARKPGDDVYSFVDYTGRKGMEAQISSGALLIDSLALSGEQLRQAEEYAKKRGYDTIRLNTTNAINPLRASQLLETGLPNLTKRE